jgi:hypothetical protein
MRFAQVSNISDNGYLGIHRTLALMVPLLQWPRVNPHATLITLFMNAVAEYTTTADRVADIMRHSETMKRLLQYLPPNIEMTPVESIKFYSTRDIVANHEPIFDR